MRSWPTLILEFLSARRTGSWEEFKRAVSAVAPPEFKPSWLSRELSSLGHVEFSYEEESAWAVAPSVLACLPESDVSTAILCGARDDRLKSRLMETAKQFDGMIELESPVQTPEVLVLHASSRASLRVIAEAAAIRLEENPAGTLAALLPSVANLASLGKAALIPEFGLVDFFDTELLAWRTWDRRQAHALMVHALPRDRYLTIVGDEVFRTDRDTATHWAIAASRKPVHRYNADEQYFAVPQRCRMPALYERALVLCSGRSPAFDPATREWRFSNVPTYIASFVSRALTTIEVAGL